MQRVDRDGITDIKQFSADKLKGLIAETDEFINHLEEECDMDPTGETDIKIGEAKGVKSILLKELSSR